jgi:carboxylesterase
MLQNPHLEGKSFYWKNNSIGIVLFHGLTATTAEVRPLAQFLFDQGYSVSCPLLPGHFTTPADLNRRTWQEWVTVGEQAYQQISTDCKQVFLAGTSMGGLVALELARKHPEASGLLLYAPAMRIPKIFIAALLWPFVPYLKKKPGSRPMPWQGYSVRSTKAVNQLRLFQNHIWRHCAEIHQPTLIMQGELDQTIDPQGATLLYQSLASNRKELIWLNDSTHCIILDRQFDIICQKTAQFIQSITLEKENIP